MRIVSHRRHGQDNCPGWRCEQHRIRRQLKTVGDRQFRNCFDLSQNALTTRVCGVS